MHSRFERTRCDEDYVELVLEHGRHMEAGAPPSESQDEWDTAESTRQGVQLASIQPVSEGGSSVLCEEVDCRVACAEARDHAVAHVADPLGVLVRPEDAEAPLFALQ